MLAINIITTILCGFIGIVAATAGFDKDLNKFGKAFTFGISLTQVLAIVAVWL